MWPAWWLDRFIGPSAAIDLLDAALLTLLTTAIGACLATGLHWTLTATVVVCCVAVEYVREWIIPLPTPKDRSVDTGSTRLLAVTRDVGAVMDVEPPETAVVDDPGTGVALHRTAGGPVIAVSRTVLDELDPEELRGIVGHEIAHHALGHLRRVQLRQAVEHVVGFSVLWTLVLSRVDPTTATGLAVVYLAGAVVRDASLFGLTYTFLHFGSVVLPRAVTELENRLRECVADDLGLSVVPQETYARSLHRQDRLFDRIVEHREDLVVVSDVRRSWPSFDSRWSPESARWPSPADRLVAAIESLLVGYRRFAWGMGRIFATHPTVEYRISRLGFSRADFE